MVHSVFLKQSNPQKIFAEGINHLEFFLKFKFPGSIPKNSDAFLANISSGSDVHNPEISLFPESRSI